MNFKYFIPVALGADAMVALEVEPAAFVNVYTGVRPDIRPFQPGPEFQKVGVAPCDVQFILHFWRRPWRFEMRLPNGSRLAKENTGSGMLLRPDRVIFTVHF